MKKLTLVVLSLVLLLALSACQEGIINSELEITDTAGGGSKTITVDIYKTGALNKNGDEIKKNDAHLPNGTQGVVDKLKAECALEDAVIEIIESNDDMDVVGITYTWKNIDEYNEKTKKFAKGAEITPATLEVDGDKVTFSEDPRNYENSIKWALEAVYNDPEVYDPWADGMNNEDDPVELGEYANTFDYVIVVGDQSTSIDMSKVRTNEVELPETLSVTATGLPDPAETEEPAETEDPVETEKPAETEDPKDESPKTGDFGVAMFLVAALVAGTALVVVRKKALN